MRARINWYCQPYLVSSGKVNIEIFNFVVALLKKCAFHLVFINLKCQRFEGNKKQQNAFGNIFSILL